MSSEELSDGENELLAIIEDEAGKEDAKESTVIASKRPSANEYEDETATKRNKSDDNLGIPNKSDYEKRLEKLLFGDKTTLLEKLKETENEKTNSSEVEQKPKRTAAWHDSDDDDFQIGDVVKENKYTGSLSHLNKEKKYSEYLKNKFNRLQAPPKWADLDREREVDSDEEILQTVGHLAQVTSTKLPANNIENRRLKDINRATYSEGLITSVQFHPTSTVALVAGLSGIASIYSIDGTKNEKLHSIKFQKYPIKCAKILPNGTECLIGGSKNFYFSYDLMKAEATKVYLSKGITQCSKFQISSCGKYFAVCGRFGEVHLMDLKTKELLHTLKQEYPCTDLQFSNDSNKLITHSSGPEVNIFDIRQQKIEHVFTDDGCISGKTITISPNSKTLVTGSNEGVVNIYNYSECFESRNPQPQKIIYNLQTAISDTKFNQSSEILGICSEAVPGAVKLIHFPTGTVFANFPLPQANLGHVKVLEFSPSSGYLALGNLQKAVPLYRLKHFNNY